MTDFQARTIQTAATKVKAATQARELAKASIKHNEDAQFSLYQSHQRLALELPQLRATYSAADDALDEATDHYDKVCANFAQEVYVI